MGDSENDDAPILQKAWLQSSDRKVGIEHRFNYSRSTSMFTTTAGSMPSKESGESFVSHTAPLRNERRTVIPNSGPLHLGRRPEAFLPHSGPLYMNQNSENAIIPVNTLLASMTPRIRSEGFRQANGMTRRDDAEVSHTAKNEHLMKSGLLGRCSDPFCTTCPTYYDVSRRRFSVSSSVFDTRFHNAYGDAKNWVTRSLSFIQSHIPGVMNPHAKVVQHWNKFFVISCLVAVFIDPLFFFLLSVHEKNKCIILDWTLATVVACVRSMTDFIYLLHMLLQFRLAYVAPESRVVGAGDLVDHPKKIAYHYFFSRYFWVDLFVVLPLPQIMILGLFPKYVKPGSANYAKNMLRAVVLLQYIPRMSRFLPLLAGQTPSGFIFESAWANFVINLLTFVLAGHVVGSCWYLFGLQRVNQCFRDACRDSNLDKCFDYIDCGRGDRKFDDQADWSNWKNNSNATNCLITSSNYFAYGIYVNAVSITTKRSIITRYIYSLFWGFQQISTLAGNQVPSSFVWEVLFTMLIIGLGLLLFALLIGNMQNFLQALGRRKLEKQLRSRDVEQWMSHRRLPDKLRRRVRQSERFSWAATRGVNEEQLIINLPEDLQREIRQHLFKFIKKVRIFTLMDDDILDAICEKLKQKLFIEGSEILRYGFAIEKMFFIVRGTLISTWEDSGYSIPLSEGDVCGEELLTWCLEHTSVNRDERKMNPSGQRLISSRTVTCISNVEAFSLHINDLEEVTHLFARLLRNPRVQGAIRYESPYWRAFAATRIQVAWRYRRRRRTIRTSISASDHNRNSLSSLSRSV